MKTKLTINILTSLTAGSMLVLSTRAAENEVDKRDAVRRPARLDDQARLLRPERLGKVAKASDVIGMEIKNAQDEKLGKVNELAVDIQSGRIVEVIVSSGGILGVGDKTFAVPPREFSCDDTKKVLRLDMDKEKLRGAPAFEISKWEESSGKQRVMENYRYYGQEPYFLGRTYATKNADATKYSSTTTTHPQPEKASKLIGMTVQNKQDEKLGKVENLILDLANGRIAQVIISSGGFLGIGDELSVAPPTAFHYDESRRVLHLDTTKEALAQAPHFKNNEWPNLEDPAYAGQVYSAYHVQPYFNSQPDADNTARNVRDRQATQLTPLDQGSSKADVEMSRRIRKEILAREGLSTNARNVKVITVNGRVTMRGPVNSEEEKRVLAEIASRIVESGKLDNQLEVKGQLTPASTEK